MSAKILEIRAKLNSKLNTCSVHIAMSRWFVDMKRLWGSCSLKAGLCLELKIDQQWSQVPLGMASKGFILTWWQWIPTVRYLSELLPTPTGTLCFIVGHCGK